MANVDRPNGAVPLRRYDGSAPLPANPYPVDASNSTAIFIGDFITQEADGACAPAAAGNRLLGVCVGVADDYGDLSRRYLPASTAGTIWVQDDPWCIFEVQEDSDSSTLALADVGLNCDHIAGSGDTATSISGHEIDSSDAATNDGGLRLLRLVNRPDNAVGAQARWEVLIIQHTHTSETGL
jgi:hypothetical protein